MGDDPRLGPARPERVSTIRTDSHRPLASAVRTTATPAVQVSADPMRPANSGTATAAARPAVARVAAAPEAPAAIAPAAAPAAAPADAPAAAPAATSAAAGPAAAAEGVRSLQNIASIQKFSDRGTLLQTHISSESRSDPLAAPSSAQPWMPAWATAPGAAAPARPRTDPLS
eukprot:3654204-Prymnesium_polylepis.1